MADMDINRIDAPYVWRSSYPDMGFPDQRNCVPYIIEGHQQWAEEILHTMNVSCECSGNRDADVECYAKIGETWYHGTHKPGQCPHLRYGAPTVPDEDEDEDENEDESQP